MMVAYACSVVRMRTRGGMEAAQDGSAGHSDHARVRSADSLVELWRACRRTSATRSVRG